MAVRWTATLLCGLLAATLAQATFSTPAVLNLGPDVIKERMTQKLTSHNATAVLQQLPLLSAMQEESSQGLLSGLADTILKHVVWLKVTSAAITQLQIQPSDQDQELVINIPLDMVAGFNTPLVKTIVEMHMQSEVKALIRVDSEQVGPSSLVLSDCFNRQGSLRISLLGKISFWVSSLVNKVTSLLMPALPKLVKTQLCPVIQAAFKDMFQDFLKLGKPATGGSLDPILPIASRGGGGAGLRAGARPGATGKKTGGQTEGPSEAGRDRFTQAQTQVCVAPGSHGQSQVPIPLRPGGLLFDLVSTDIEGNVIQLNLQAKLLDSQSKVTNWLNDSSVSLVMPALDCSPFSFVMRQDLLNAVVAVLLPPDKLTVLLDYVLPDLAKELKSSIKEISEEAAEKLDRTQLVKFQTRKTPQLLLSQDGAQAAQLIVLDLFPTNKAQRPLFTLGIEAKSEAQFYTEGDQLVLSFNDIRTERIVLMNSDIKLFNPELLKDIVTKILNSALLITENGKLRTGIPMLIPKALGYKSVTPCVTKDALVLAPATSWALPVSR
ncbi:BPI fold-containing family B member 1 [Callospermophilus lateralis]|uniref:BPI fold-containing family B member 1 n=1 Tax=Callospermophilus lateralis TaxID=76772 RepID=UPI004038A84F